MMQVPFEKLIVRTIQTAVFPFVLGCTAGITPPAGSWTALAPEGHRWQIADESVTAIAEFPKGSYVDRQCAFNDRRDFYCLVGRTDHGELISSNLETGTVQKTLIPEPETAGSRGDRDFFSRPTLEIDRHDKIGR